jgi:lysozyme family protein
MITGFADVWAMTVKVEGESLSTDRNDPGNWTGGAVGGGEFRGSKFGISAAAFPNTDIAALTYGGAQALAKQRYWDAYQCDQFNPVVGYLLFDAAYNGGHPAQWLQQSVGVDTDGHIGAQTIAAVRAHGVGQIALRFMALRQNYWTECGAWGSEGRGWIHRGSEIMQTVAGCLC